MFEFAPVSPKIRALLDKKAKANNGNIVINAERTKIYTDYYRTHEMEHNIMKRAHCLYEWCAKKKIFIDDDDFFAGNMAPTYRGTSPYVEWNVRWINDAVNDSDESFKAAWQTPGCTYMSDEDREIFRDACEFWKDRTFPARMESIVPQMIYDIHGNGVTDFATRYTWFSDMPTGHYVTNYNKAIHVGFAEIRRQALEKMAGMEGKVFGNDARRYTFYRSVVIVCDGIILLMKRYAELAAEKAAKAADPELKAKFEKMADSLNWISENPCRNTWEAFEVILLYYMILVCDAQQHGLTLGRMDQYAGYFLDKELAEGVYSQEEAQELVDAFILKMGDNLALSTMPPNPVLAGMAKEGKCMTGGCNGQHFTVGGVKKDGTDATNSLTLCFLQTYGRLFLVEPSISCRVHKNTPDIVWQYAIESSKIAGGMPTIESDECIIPGLMLRGLSMEDARDYAIVGCVEPVGCGTEWSACGNTGRESFWCMIGTMVLAIHNGTNPMTNVSAGLKTGYLYEHETFESFKAAVEAQMHYFLNWHVTYTNFFELMYADNYPCISASVTMEGCMESGLDVTWGGAKYNSTGLTCLGIGNMADSLMTIKKLCFEEKRYTLKELYDALCADWVGYEELQEVIINEVPHYGNNIDEVDALAVWAMNIFADHMNNAYGPRGYFRPGTFTMTTHLPYGAMTAATPDGRKAGSPLAEAISPRQGFDKNGPTALLASASKLPHIKLLNGDQMNIRFNPATVKGDEGTQKLREMFQTYFDMGGMQIQFNVVSTDDLHKAQKAPDEFKDMIVRIAGFSVYFVEMPKPLQDDFITRTEQQMG